MTAFDKLFALSTVNAFLCQWDCIVNWYQKIIRVKLLKEKNGLVLLVTSDNKLLQNGLFKDV